MSLGALGLQQQLSHLCVVSRGIVLKGRNNHKNAISRNSWAALMLAEKSIAGFIEFTAAESDRVQQNLYQYSF